MGNNSGNICNDFYSSYPASNYLPGVFGDVGIGGMIIGFVYFCSSAITIAWIRKQQQNALRGMEGAAKHVVFPIYLPIMWVSAISDAFLGLVIFFVKRSTDGATSWTNSVVTACALAVQHFVIEGIAIILMQYGCGMRAIRIASLAGGVVGVYTFLTVLFYYRSGSTSEAAVVLYFCWLIALLVFYSCIWLLPRKRLYRRPAVIFYAKFWTLFQILVILSEALAAFGPHLIPEASTISTCVYYVIALPVFVVFKPFVMYTTLLMESKWWQGLLIRSNTEDNSRGRGSLQNKDNTRPVRYIRSVESIDQMEGSPGRPSGSGSSAGDLDNSLGTSGSDTRDSDYHSDTDLPKGMFASFVHMMYDAFSLFSFTTSKGSMSSSLQSGEDGNAAHNTHTTHTHSVGAGSTLDSARRLFTHRTNYDQIKAPLMGVEVGFSEAQTLAQEVDNINTLGTVKLLNFAYLSLENKGKKLLGSGSFSKVYAGQYRNHPVAVKMLFTQDLNPDVIKRCSNEAKILTEVSPHPNVVHIFGVAVLPPSVCLVLEICEYGSLSDVLRGPGDGTLNRPPLNLSYSDRMYLALGCARGLQALHSYSPMLCHRDIKSFNFLIDSQLNAKIADLDLGHQYDEDPNHTAGSNSGGNIEADGEDEHTGLLNPSSKKSSSGVGNNSTINVRNNGSAVKVGGSNMCIYWQAPEVLRGEQYTQKSDIHSLALVIWEIVSAGKIVKFYSNSSRDSTGMQPGGHLRSTEGSGPNGSAGQLNSAVSYGSVPYAECKNMDEVRAKVIKGLRPIIPAAIGSPGSVKSITGGLARPPDPILLDIMQLGWHADPQMRPDIDYIVEGLLRCWRNSLHTTIFETEFIVDLQKIQEENFKLTVLQDYSSTSGGGSKGFRGSNITMASSFLGSKMSSSASGSSHGHHASDNSSTHSGGSAAHSTLSTYSRSQGQQRVVRKPPSPEVIASLLLMKSEPNWSKLEDEGAYLVLTPVRPFYMLWATRKWTQLTGYLVNDVIAYDISTLLGPKADHFAFEECLESAGAYGKAEHIMSTIYRRDGKPLPLSVHMFPVFDKTRPSYYPDSGHQSRDSSYALRMSSHSVHTVSGTIADNTPGRMSFSKYDGSNIAADSDRLSATPAAAAGTDAQQQERLTSLLTSNTPVVTPTKQKPNSTFTTTAATSAASTATAGVSDGNGAAGVEESKNSGGTGSSGNSGPPLQRKMSKMGSSSAPVGLMSPPGASVGGSIAQQQLYQQQAQQQQQVLQRRNTGDLQASTGTASSGVSGTGRAESDKTPLLERKLSHTGGVLSPVRSTSNVFTAYNGLVLNKASGAATPITARSRAPSNAPSQHDSAEYIEEDEQYSTTGVNASALCGNNAMFDSMIEDESAHRHVAYIAVQFSCIKDPSS